MNEDRTKLPDGGRWACEDAGCWMAYGPQTNGCFPAFQVASRKAAIVGAWEMVDREQA